MEGMKWIFLSALHCIFVFQHGENYPRCFLSHFKLFLLAFIGIDIYQFKQCNQMHLLHS